MTKIELLAIILREIRRAQHEKWTPPRPGPIKKIRLPPSLPAGDGKQISATEELLKAVAQYAALYLANEPELRARFKIAEIEKIAAEVFGEKLASLDLDEPDSELLNALKENVDKSLALSIGRNHEPIELTLGCHLLKGDKAYPIIIGPVMFETRNQWLQRALSEDKISSVAGRRLAKLWSGARIRNRKPSFDAHYERSVINAIGGCEVVCTVTTIGLSSQMTQEKALLAARLSMTALSLMWSHPSQGLQWMNLYYDGRTFNRDYIMVRPYGFAGSSSSISQLPSGRWTDGELISELLSYQPIFNQVGEALFNYVQPSRGVSRPKLMNSLFLSLWWFHQACRESSDQMATTKFAASMDALAGGHKAGGIVKLIGARIGFAPEEALMISGQTTKQVVASFYDAGRSRLIHGSSNNFAHDWSQVRSSAEAVGRLCLVQACDWLTKNREGDDVAKLSQP